MEQVDMLVIGAHPDDLEIGMGGTIAKHVQLGYKVGLVDLTRGEMGANGTPEQRLAEGERARQILGCTFRCNLNLPDGGVEHSKANVARLVELIRKTKPKIIFATYYQDKHPDHVACGKIAREAFFVAGLHKAVPGLPPHRAKQLIYYIGSPQITPSFIVDVSATYQQKKQAVLAHESQFFLRAGSVPTLLNKENGYPEILVVRDKFWGMQIGAAYGEGFYLENTLPVDDIPAMWDR